MQFISLLTAPPMGENHGGAWGGLAPPEISLRAGNGPNPSKKNQVLAPPLFVI